MIIDYRPIDTIPWHRLTTCYGRATDIPTLIAEKKYDELAQLIEHQGTLWQATPWALQQLLFRLQNSSVDEVTSDEIDLYLAVSSAFVWEEATSQPVEHMDELLQEKWLWDEDSDEDDDEMEWEEEVARGYEEQAFVSYFLYSEKQLHDMFPKFREIAKLRADLTESVSELITCLDNRPFETIISNLTK